MEPCKWQKAFGDYFLVCDEDKQLADYQIKDAGAPDVSVEPPKEEDKGTWYGWLWASFCCMNFDSIDYNWKTGKFMCTGNWKRPIMWSK